MADRHPDETDYDNLKEKPQPEDVAGGAQWNPLATAAIIGGAVAATAGAYLGTRALARRNSRDGKQVNSVMKAAITATDMANCQAGKEPEVRSEPRMPSEPKLRT